ncbi:MULTISPECIES: LysR substrate-binding domain-containing protein [unclassified Ruegeria]|uniref:LysR substrate-binding domain-containing protein n=1 Tax=unclassified Ruegeria TaxID=2625375 RepID=UPI001489249B|nr:MULTISPECIES: LysR substrate-binding domain-containing protein [unclassified Ruegeria]NOD64929.1 LysR family transcriptional regulator [Ruegeria sp. HKCCD6109]
MPENLRHLRALQAFDETATHSNLTKAADVLNVTHGAISRQIKLLELHLGATLFHRRPNGVELTNAGERLYQSTRGAFSALQLGVTEVKRLHHRQSITVSLSTSLALKWLVPLLTSFQQEHPGIALLLDTNDGFADFDTSEVDVALRFGKPDWEGLHHEQIRREELVVVAAPSLVGTPRHPMRAKDVAELPLLHDAFNVGWESWASQVGLSTDQIKSQNIKYVDSAVLLEAAIDGQGVALARHLLAERDLKLGRLIRLDDSSVPLDRGLYFVCRPGDQERVTVRIFKKWLMSI